MRGKAPTLCSKPSRRRNWSLLPPTTRRYIHACSKPPTPVVPTTSSWHILNHTYSKTRKVILAGNIGIPLFDIADQLDPDTLVVAEFSCHQLENIHRSAHIGIILNLYQEHLDHYHNYLDYQMAKMQLMLRQQPGDHCLYCTDSPDLTQRVDQLRPQLSTTLHPFNLEMARQMGLNQVPSHLQGDHNLSNILATRLAAELCGVSPQQFAQALNTFHGLPHRLELVGTYNGITFYNDSISTIPQPHSNNTSSPPPQPEPTSTTSFLLARPAVGYTTASTTNLPIHYKT